MIEHTTNLVGQSGSSLRRAGVGVWSEYTDVPGGSVSIKAGAIAACTSLEAAQPAKPLVPALTSEQIQASQARAPKYDRSVSMEQARQATFKGRPLGAIVQKSFAGVPVGFERRPAPSLQTVTTKAAIVNDHHLPSHAGARPAVDRAQSPRPRRSASRS